MAFCQLEFDVVAISRVRGRNKTRVGRTKRTTQATVVPAPHVENAERGTITPSTTMACCTESQSEK